MKATHKYEKPMSSILDMEPEGFIATSGDLNDYGDGGNLTSVKKIPFLMIAAMCLLLAGCSKSEMNKVTIRNKNENFTVTASLPNTKTTFDFDNSTNKAKVLWTSNDGISVVNNTHSADGKFTTSASGVSSATFSGSLTTPSAGDKLYAFYPCVTSGTSSATFDCSVEGESQAVMYASADYAVGVNTQFNFKNAMSLLRIELTLPSGAGTISSVTLAGTGLVNGGTLSAADGSWSSTTSGDVKVNGSWTPASNKIVVYAHVIPQTLPVLNIIASDGTNTYVATMSSSAAISAGFVYRINKTAAACSQIYITVGNSIFTATLYDNTAANEFKALLPLTLNMTNLGDQEKYNYMSGHTFTTAASVPSSINIGDLYLYTTNCIVLFYKNYTTTYSYTPLGHINDVTGLIAALGSGNVDVKFSLKPASLSALSVVSAPAQQTFPSTITAGDYSGITKIDDSHYAVVSDKSATDGFFEFTLDISSAGVINSAAMGSLISSGASARDAEGIVYYPAGNGGAGSLFISGEADKSVYEYTMSGARTGRSLAVPAIFSGASSNYNLESLAYNAHTGLFWTTTESTLPADGVQATSTNGVANMLRIQAFNTGLQPVRQYAYRMDTPSASSAASVYAMGVSDLLALDDGRLVVLEREFYVPTSVFGAFVTCKLYVVDPGSVGAAYEITSSDVLASAPFLPKTLLYSFTTSLNSLTDNTIANYEGMCLGPVLASGNQSILLISDSQSNYGGQLKDWFKVIEVK